MGRRRLDTQIPGEEAQEELTNFTIKIPVSWRKAIQIRAAVKDEPGREFLYNALYEQLKPYIELAKKVEAEEAEKEKAKK